MPNSNPHASGVDPRTEALYFLRTASYNFTTIRSAEVKLSTILDEKLELSDVGLVSIRPEASLVAVELCSDARNPVGFAEVIERALLTIAPSLQWERLGRHLVAPIFEFAAVRRCATLGCRDFGSFVHETFHLCTKLVPGVVLELGTEGWAVTVDTDEDFTPEEARHRAAQLLSAADEAERLNAEIRSLRRPVDLAHEPEQLGVGGGL